MANVMRTLRRSMCMYMCIAISNFSMSASYGTQQQGDRLLFGNREYAMFQVPMLGLWYYGEGEPPKGKFRAPALEITSTANWSGYSATWEIRDKKLQLRSINGRLKGRNAKNEEIITNRKFPVEATWFSGQIYLAVGDFSQRTQEYEAVVVFGIERGNVTSMTFHPTARLNYSWNGLETNAK